MKILSNQTALQSLNILSRVNTQIEDNSLRTASNDRIARAAFDPAGLAISEKMKANIRSAGQAKRNANDGISAFQIAEGAMAEVHSMGIRMRELAMQAASDTLGDEERSMINREFNAVKSEIERIALSTSFNGKKLLDGQGGLFQIQVGIKNEAKNDRLGVNVGKVDTTLSALGLNGAFVGTKIGAQTALGTIDSMIQKVSAGRTEMGAMLNRIDSSIQNLESYNENTSSGRSRIRDADLAVETSDRAKLDIQRYAASAALTQSKEISTGALKLLS